MKARLALGLVLLSGLLPFAPCWAAEPVRPLVVEIVISDEGILLDFAGPAEVFREAYGVNFSVYYVAQTLKPVRLKGGMTITPNYTYRTAPLPDYVVVGTQGGAAPPEALQWLQALRGDEHAILSVCTGSDWLGQAGLLDHKEATTHHNQFDQFGQRFPAVKLVEGKRYVQSDPYIFTAAGFTAGMDLALHILDLRFGNEVARKTAARLEYQGQGWVSNENAWAAGAGR